MARRVVILGSTGSIGRSALDVIRRSPEEFEVVGLGVHSNTGRLAEQIAEFSPGQVAVFDEKAGAELAAREPGVKVLTGASGLEELAGLPADVTLCAMVGAAGLRPVLAAIDAGNRLALANKEPLVMAGELVMARAREKGVQVTPVDSEHSAIWQCLAGHDVADVACIHLTASGGPFYQADETALAHVTPEQAASHPTWDMGTKVSVDSATLMNKGLEIVEAVWLFGVPLDKVQVIIHPQSIVHSLVEFTDGSMLAHLGVTDMRFPIQFALCWPQRVPEPMGRLDLASMPDLSFARPDTGRFPCLGYARESARIGGTAPAVLNAANEVAVEAFCRHRIGFLDIARVVGDVLERCSICHDITLDAVLTADHEARTAAEASVSSLGNPARKRAVLQEN